jgi:hypothetical protein
MSNLLRNLNQEDMAFTEEEINLLQDVFKK